MKMPFGKYQGTTIEQLPRHYLKWALRNINLTDALRGAMEAALNGDDMPLTIDDKLKAIIGKGTQGTQGTQGD